MSESHADYVELKGFENSSMGVEEMIEFCYSGLLTITTANIDQLLHVATHLQIQQAIDLCSQFLIHSCSMSNCIELYHIVEFYALSSVLPFYRDFISKNFAHLMLHAREQFEQLTYEHIQEELTSDVLNMHNYDEYHLFVMICTWIDVNRAQREQYTCHLFEQIRFMLMTPEQLTDHVRDHVLINLNEQSRKLVENALCFYALPNRQVLVNSKQNQIRNHSVLVAIDQTELFMLNMEQDRWEPVCSAPLEANYPVRVMNKKHE
jgi:hypothetical protein